MQERNTLKKSLSASGLGEEEMLASVKNAVGAKPRRIRISRLGLIAASLAAVTVLCSAGFAVIPAFRKYLDSRVKENVVYTDISTMEELEAVRDDLTGSYRLVCDIVIDENAYADGGIFEGGFVPLGNEDKAFTGIFNGNGHTIKNLRLNADRSYVGLFGLTHSYSGIGIIMNLALENVTLEESHFAPSSRCIGAVAGKAAYVGRCSVKGFDTGEAGSAAGNIVGGIAGQADIIESCYTDTSIGGSSGNKGAIAGIVCTLTDCCAESDSPLCGTINRLPALMTDAAFGKFCTGFGEETDVCEKFKAFYSEIDLDAPEQNYLKLPSPSGKASGISPDGVRSVYSLYNFGSADELKTARIFDRGASGQEIALLNEKLEQYFTPEETGKLLFGEGSIIGVTNSFTVKDGETYRGLDLKDTWVMTNGKPALRVFVQG